MDGPGRAALGWALVSAAVGTALAFVVNVTSAPVEIPAGGLHIAVWIALPALTCAAGYLAYRAAHRERYGIDTVVGALRVAVRRQWEDDPVWLRVQIGCP
jgi:hypothetical protein